MELFSTVSGLYLPKFTSSRSSYEASKGSLKTAQYGTAEL